MADPTDPRIPSDARAQEEQEEHRQRRPRRSDLTPRERRRRRLEAGKPRSRADRRNLIGEPPAPTEDEPGGDPAARVEPPVQPAPVEPTSVEPTSVEPAPVEPTPVEPASVEPAPVEPAPVEPASVEPASVEPAPVEPARQHPAPARPPWQQPTAQAESPVEPTPVVSPRQHPRPAAPPWQQAAEPFEPAPVEFYGPSPAEVALEEEWEYDEAAGWGRGSTSTVPSDPAVDADPDPVTGRIRKLRPYLVAGAIALATVAAVALGSGLLERARDLVTPADVDEGARPVATDDQQPSIALVTYDETDASGLATGLVVLGYDHASEQGTVLLVPVATVADVPGYGAFQLSEAHAFGQGALVGVTLDNLLGIRVDGLARLSEQSWAALLTRVGGFEVEVRSRLVDRSEGAGETRFEPGVQFLDGPRLAEYLTFREDVETELETLPRTQQVISGLLDRIAQEPETLDALFADGAPMVDTTDPELFRAVLEELAAARADDAVTTLTLPVTTLGSGRDDLYRIDAARVEQLVTDRFAASRPEDGAGAGRSVQILNGNGVPGIGQQVAERLSDGGYRIVLTGNADRFDQPTTKIVVYGESDEQLEVARDVQERLGVGQIERSGTPQSVVDVTIVVGVDFPPDG